MTTRILASFLGLAMMIVLSERGGLPVPVVREATASTPHVHVQHGQKDNTRSTSTERPVLWLLSCETRDRPIPWFLMAEKLKNASSEGVDVHVANVCEGAKWQGFITKPVAMEKFLQEHVGGITPKEKTYVLFSDSDALINGWALPDASQILERYHDITSMGKHSIVFGGEPNCWMGRNCEESDYRLVYPDAPNRTSCPFFLNSGLYMGTAETVTEIVHAALGKSNDTHYTALVGKIFDEKVEGEGRRYKHSDQARMAAWYSLNRDKAIVDTRASLFRNLFFGKVDSSKFLEKNKDFRASCGLGGVLTCGYYNYPISGHYNQSAKTVVMDPVPTCPTEPMPLFLHGNGGTGKTLAHLQKELTQAGLAISSNK